MPAAWGKSVELAEISKSEAGVVKKEARRGAGARSKKNAEPGGLGC